MQLVTVIITTSFNTSLKNGYKAFNNLITTTPLTTLVKKTNLRKVGGELFNKINR
jgi:hypothetical protein